jgi:aspartyl-tRNA(Asn)/glutamyl-tRNA(Gln) amidotransferase subunit A
MHKLTLAETIKGLARGDFSSRELSQHYLARIASLDGELNSLVSVTGEQALAAADQADQQRAAGAAGPLSGIPIVHKDIFCTRGVATTCGSRMLENFVPPYESSVSRKLADAGVVMLGKANMDEFAMGSSNETSYFGAVRNPWDPDRVPGGSSGGSAAAVAAGLAVAATGTDTGGSIRQPASLCGLTGIKPTYGRCSRYGMIAFASSLDQAGVLARNAEDAALLLQGMSGFDPLDSTSADREVDDYLAGLHNPIDGMVIGIPEQYFSQALDSRIGDNIQRAIAELESLGARTRSISLPHTELAVPAYYVVAPAEASANLARFDGVRYGHRCENPADLQDLYRRSRAEGFGEEVKRRILVGTYVLSAGYYDAYYRQAQKVRRLIKNDFVDAFADVDLVLGPTCPSTAFKLGEKTDDPVQMYLEDIFTIPASLAGLPAMSVPVAQVDGLPVGIS